MTLRKVNIGYFPGDVNADQTWRAFEKVNANVDETEARLTAAVEQTEAIRSDLSSTSDPEKGARAVGYKGRTLYEKMEEATSITDYGARGDARSQYAGLILVGQHALTDAGASFTSADVGKLVRIDGAGAAGAKLVTTIASVSTATTVVLADAASTSVYGAALVYGTDSTAAIDAAFAHVAAQAAQSYNSNETRAIVTLGNRVALRVPGGHYLYNGAGFDPSTQASRVIVLMGDGSSSTTLEITSDAYLVDCPADWTAALNFFAAEGMKVCGGKGLFLNRATFANDEGDIAGGGGGVPQAGHYLRDVRILDFSEVAFGSYWTGTANWSVTYCWIETTRPNTKGLLFNPQVANPDLTGTTIVGCTYKIVFLPAGIAATYIQNMAYMHSLAEDDHEADIWLMAIDAGVEGYANAGNGLIIRGNRLSNEFRNGKPVVLIADYEAGSEPLHLRRHSTSATTKVMRDVSFVDNVAGGTGTADTAGPLIRSYTQELGRMVVRNNSLSRSFSYLLELMTPPTGIGYMSDTVLGPNDYQGGGEPPMPCNYPIGIWRGPQEGEEIPSPGTPLSGAGGYDPNFLLMSSVAGSPVVGDDLTLNGGVTRAAATDALGGTNAREYTFTSASSSEWANIPIGTADTDPYGNIFVEFDVRAGATQALQEIDVEITLNVTGGGTETIRRSIQPTAEWLPVRIPVNIGGVVLSGTVRFFASPDSFAAGVRDKVRIGRPRVYRANRPVNYDHIFVGNHSWDAGRGRRVGQEAGQQFTDWIDWTNSQWLTKFASAGASEADPAALLVPLMAARGFGQAFTPTLFGGATVGAGTYTANAGRYFRLGQLIIGFARVIWTAHTGTGTMTIDLGTLPACRNDASSRGMFLPLNYSGFSLSAGTALSGFVAHNTNDIALSERSNTADTLINIAASGTLYFAFAYEAA